MPAKTKQQIVGAPLVALQAGPALLSAELDKLGQDRPRARLRALASSGAPRGLGVPGGRPGRPGRRGLYPRRRRGRSRQAALLGGPAPPPAQPHASLARPRRPPTRLAGYLGR